MPRRSVLIFAAACVAIAAVIATVAALVTLDRERADKGVVVASTGQPRVGGPFTLVDQDGRAVDQTIMEDGWSLVFFGFTYCPDFCPTTLATLKAVQDRMGERTPRIVFVSIDPARDTPAHLKNYLSSDGFPSGVVGLTGTDTQVAEAARVYRAYFQKVGEGEAYTMNHSLTVYLMGPDGRFRTALAHDLGPDRAVQVIEGAMRRG